KLSTAAGFDGRRHRLVARRASPTGRSSPRPGGRSRLAARSRHRRPRHLSGAPGCRGPRRGGGAALYGGKFGRWRASMVARSRLVEDIVAEQADRADRGRDQYVILGAGLDSFALRRPDRVRQVRVFEVDEPGTQAWKRMEATPTR